MWARIRALKKNQMYALDKQSSIRLLSIGRIIRRLIVKCTLKAGGANTKYAYGGKQLCANFEVGIKGVIHVVLEKLDESEEMPFGEWEVDDKI